MSDGLRPVSGIFGGDQWMYVGKDDYTPLPLSIKDILKSPQAIKKFTKAELNTLSFMVQQEIGQVSGKLFQSQYKTKLIALKAAVVTEMDRVQDPAQNINKFKGNLINKVKNSDLDQGIKDVWIAKINGIKVEGDLNRAVEDLVKVSQDVQTVTEMVAFFNKAKIDTGSIMNDIKELNVDKLKQLKNGIPAYKWVEECESKKLPNIEYNLTLNKGEPESQSKILQQFYGTKPANFLNRVKEYGYELLQNNSTYSRDLDRFLDDAIVLFISIHKPEDHFDLINDLYKLKMENKSKPEAVVKPRKEYTVPVGTLPDDSQIENLPENPTIFKTNPSFSELRGIVLLLKDGRRFNLNMESVKQLAQKALEIPGYEHSVLILINSVLRLTENNASQLESYKDLQKFKAELEASLVTKDNQTQPPRSRRVKFKDEE